MIPAFHDYSLEPKITKCGDLLYYITYFGWDNKILSQHIRNKQCWHNRWFCMVLHNPYYIGVLWKDKGFTPKVWNFSPNSLKKDCWVFSTHSFISSTSSYTNSLDNANSFDANFTNSTFQKIPIYHLTHTMKKKSLLTRILLDFVWIDTT